METFQRECIASSGDEAPRLRWRDWLEERDWPWENDVHRGRNYVGDALGGAIMDWLYIAIVAVVLPLLAYFGPRVFRKPHEGD